MTCLRRLAAIVVWLATGLWLGGMVHLFISVQMLFREFPRHSSRVAIDAAPRLFEAFERYQLVLAAVALLAAFAWYCAARLRTILITFVLLALAAAAAVVSTTTISAKMQTLRREGLSSSPEFKSLHARSMIFYVSQATLLLAAAVTLPLTAEARHEASAAATA